MDMRLSLKRHPDSPCDAVTAIDVDVVRTGSGLDLTYRLTGRIADLAIAGPAPSRRRDELWRRSCFEAFVRAEGEAGYREFNFAPSTEWAAYGFESYRSGMRDLAGIAPAIAPDRDAERFTLAVALDPGLPADRSWRLGLTAVVEEVSGRKSYWAVEHPGGAADFHHEDCFALQLPPAD